MKLGIVTDEVSADPETAIELGTGWGTHDFELRGVFASRAPSLSPYEKSHLRDALDAYQARVVALSPGLFKFPYPSRERVRASLAWMDREGYESWAAARKRLRYHIDELLPASLDYARRAGCRHRRNLQFRSGGSAGRPASRRGARDSLSTPPNAPGPRASNLRSRTRRVSGAIPASARQTWCGRSATRRWASIGTRGTLSAPVTSRSLPPTRRCAVWCAMCTSRMRNAARTARPYTSPKAKSTGKGSCGHWPLMATRVTFQSRLTSGRK